MIVLTLLNYPMSGSSLSTIKSLYFPSVSNMIISLAPFLMNHINSTKRPGLGNKSPYELIPNDDDDMHRLMKLLDLSPIPADDVNLTKDLLKE